MLKDYLDTNHSASLPPGASLFVAGIVGGFFAAACSHPFDTAKTRMQAFPAGGTSNQYKTLSTTIATIYKEGGAKLFFKGLVPRMTRIIGGWAAVFTSPAEFLAGHHSASPSPHLSPLRERDTHMPCLHSPITADLPLQARHSF